MKVISVVGKKNSGKTSLTVKIIKELKKRGYNVSSIKHSHHTMEMDRKDTDTWKHNQAGAGVVVGVGKSTFFNIKKDFDLNRLLFLIKHLDDTDYVVIEGFKKYNYPKIATSKDVVDEYTIKEVDSFTINDDELKELVDLIEVRSHDITDTLFANSCGYSDGEKISEDIRNGKITVDDLDKTHSYLSVNGKIVGLNRFVSDYLKQSTLGIINTLNLKDYGVDEVKNVELLIPSGQSKEVCGKITVKINDKDLKINSFTSKLLLNTVNAMVESLKTPEISTIDIEMTKSDIVLKVNESDVELNEFSGKILKETLYAQIKTLKSDGEINTIKIKTVKTC